MKATFPTLLAALATATALPAGAVTLDFESLSRGTIITNQLLGQGVLVSSVNTTHCCNPGTVLNVAAGDMGVYNFGGSGQQALVYGVSGDQLRFDFVLPNTSTSTVYDHVSLRVGDGDSAWESFRVTFRGLSGNVLSQQEFTTTSGSVFGGATVSYDGAGIHSVEVLGIGTYSGGGVDDLTFTNSVPEPSSLALAALAMGGLTLLRRRQAAR